MCQLDLETQSHQIFPFFFGNIYDETAGRKKNRSQIRYVLN